MTFTHTVTVCYLGDGGGGSNGAKQMQHVKFFQGVSAREISTILGAVFWIPGHRRVVGLAGTPGGNRDVLIPLLAACRYPGLIFRRDGQAKPDIGKRDRIVFRIVTKDIDHPDEQLFPLSALTPPPCIGSSNLPIPHDTNNGPNATEDSAAATDAAAAAAAAASLGIVYHPLPSSTGGSAAAPGGSCLTLFTGWKLDTVVIPDLVMTGALSAEDGRAVSDLVRKEDPVVISAFRIAAASATTGTAAAAVFSSAVDSKWKNHKPLAAVMRGGGAYAGDGRDRGGRRGGEASGAATVGAWRSGQVRDRLVYMIEVILENRRRRKGVMDRGGGIVARVGNYGGAGFALGSAKTLDEESRLCYDGSYTGYAGAATNGVVPEAFQADVIALADIALLTGTMSKEDYVQALYKAVTLDPALVKAYRADVRQILIGHGEKGGDEPPWATLGALGASFEPRLQSQSHLGANTPPPSPPPYQPALREVRAPISSQSPLPAPSAPPFYRSARRGMGALAAAAMDDGDLIGGELDENYSISGDDSEDDDEVEEQEAGEEDGEGDMCARESALRDRFLRRAVTLIAEARNGLTEREKALIEDAIATEHPWVSAIYDECRETGDMRGLMQNLQRLPSLLEQDRATSSGTAAAASHDGDIGRSQQQPPIPGGDEWEPPISVLEQLQQHHRPPLPPPPHLHRHIQKTAGCSQHSLNITDFQRSDGGGSKSFLPARTDSARSRPNSHSLRATAVETARGTMPATTRGEFPGLLTGRKQRSSRGDSSSRVGGAGPAGGGGGGVDSAGPQPVETALVVEQLSRVIAGCAHLLELRGTVGKYEQEALRVMSERASPVLLAAVEVFGANQDLEDLLDTLTEAARAEVSLTYSTAADNNDGRKKTAASGTSPPCTAAVAASPGRAAGEGGSVGSRAVARSVRRSISPRAKYLEENPSPYYIYLSQQGREPRFHHRHQQHSFGSDMSHARGGSNGGRGECQGGESGKHGDDSAVNTTNGELISRTNNGYLYPDVTTAESSSTDTHGFRSPGFGLSSPPLGNNLDGEGFPNVSGADTGSPAQVENASTVSLGESGDGFVGGDRNANVEAAAAAAVAGNLSEAAEGSSDASRNSKRKAAAGLRAQELAAAKFAGMKKTAAAAQGAGEADADSARGSASSGEVKGPPRDAEPSGDKRLRQDVSQLISVMKKHGMLTDQQRLFLLAQVGRRITRQARRHHLEYARTGDSKVLYAVLMALSTPSRRPVDDDSDEDEDNDDGDDVDGTISDALAKFMESEELEEYEELDEIEELEESVELEGSKGSEESDSIEEEHEEHGEVESNEEPRANEELGDRERSSENEQNEGREESAGLENSEEREGMETPAEVKNPAKNGSNLEEIEKRSEEENGSCDNQGREVEIVADGGEASGSAGVNRDEIEKTVLPSMTDAGAQERAARAEHGEGDVGGRMKDDGIGDMSGMASAKQAGGGGEGEGEGSMSREIEAPVI